MDNNYGWQGNQNYNMNYNPNNSQNYSQSFNQGNGQNYSQNYNQNYNQNYGQNYSQDYNQNNGQNYSQNYGQNYGQNYNQNNVQSYSQNYSQNYNQDYNRNYNPNYNQNYNQNYTQNNNQKDYNMQQLYEKNMQEWDRTKPEISAELENVSKDEKKGKTGELIAGIIIGVILIFFAILIKEIVWISAICSILAVVFILAGIISPMIAGKNKDYDNEQEKVRKKMDCYYAIKKENIIHINPFFAVTDTHICDRKFSIGVVNRNDILMIYSEKRNSNDEAAGFFNNMRGIVGYTLAEIAKGAGTDYYAVIIITNSLKNPQPIAISENSGEADSYMYLLSKYCPNARLDNTSENRKYVKKMIKMNRNH